MDLPSCEDFRASVKRFGGAHEFKLMVFALRVIENRVVVYDAAWERPRKGGAVRGAGILRIVDNHAIGRFNHRQ